MQVIKTNNYEDMSRVVAEMFIAQITAKPTSVLGLATGSTPESAYKLLVQAYENKQVDFSQVTTVNLDEYHGLTPDNPQSYRYFMNSNLFNLINIDKNKTHVPSGTAANPDAECERYEKLIEEVGGIDLQLLGMGHNGHLAFNEPGEELSPVTHHVYLSETTIKANSRFFETYEDVPKSAISMGMKSIMSGRKLILAVSGNAKANILKKALYGPITTQIPASLLQLHNDVTVVTDCL
ncbi:MAG: glucosamine-6-phosphate deaminase [Oscillospiraceae bacterium]|nr:glucosamine-6-phosphate deaminase [Oscillospiraceae bacterium]